MPTTSLARLRLVALLEGASFLVLLGIAMPLKYLANMPIAVRVVGLLHGVLFLAFLYLLVTNATEREWSWKRTLLGFVASLLPFGPFVFDRELAKEERAAS